MWTPDRLLGSSPGCLGGCHSRRSPRSFSTVWTGGKERRRRGTSPCQEDLHGCRRDPCALLLHGLTSSAQTLSAPQQKGTECRLAATGAACTPAAGVPRDGAHPGGEHPRPRCLAESGGQRSAPHAGLPDRPFTQRMSVPSPPAKPWRRELQPAIASPGLFTSFKSLSCSER